jgi:hypothetical protein
MGNLCNRTCLAKLLFKQRIKREIIHLLHKIINDDECNCYVGNRRLMKLKNQMTVVRGMSNEWNVMTNQCVAKGYDTHTTVKNILEIMPESEESLKIGNILCLCTYVTDVCVMMLSRNESTDVCKIINVLTEYMIEKNIVMCVKFLQYLDVV